MMSHVVLAQDIELLVARLGLHTSSQSMRCQTQVSTRGISAFSTNHSSQCARFFDDPTPERINLSRKHERFSIQNIRNISSLGHQGSRLFQAANTIPLISDALSAGIEMVYRDPFLSANSTLTPNTQLGTQVVLKGSMKRMTYRAVYGYTGQDIGRTLSFAPNDQLGGKLLWEWQLPFVTPKVELSRFSNNVDHDPTRQQMISTRQQYSLDWTLPNLPSFTLGYGREQKDILSLSDESRSRTTLRETVTTKIAFERSRGKGEWASRLSSSQNDIHDQGILEELHSTLKGTLNLYAPLKISPSFGFTRKNNAKQDFAQIRRFANLETIVRLSTEQTIQPSFEWNRMSRRNQGSISNILLSKLRYSYEPSTHGYHISIMGQYVLNQTTQQTSNPQTYDMSVFIQKDLHDLFNLPHQQQTVSLKFTHNQQVNTVPSKTHKKNSTAMLLVSIIP